MVMSPSVVWRITPSGIAPPVEDCCMEDCCMEFCCMGGCCAGTAAGARWVGVDDE